MQREVKYRPDIDGLRALAVVAIIAFHLGISRIGGGFVGVDIFYVISGFLIGGIIIGELERETFSIWRFYQRRLKRILPALVATLVLTTVIALFVLFPTELSDYARSMIATSLWAANVYFWETTNYFRVDKTTPLLHCWSLGVEEQYYLFFPLLMTLVFRLRPAQLPAIMTLLAAGSFALSIALTVSAPMANFYLLPTRAWELFWALLRRRFPYLNSVGDLSVKRSACQALVLSSRQLFTLLKRTSRACLPCRHALEQRL